MVESVGFWSTIVEAIPMSPPSGTTGMKPVPIESGSAVLKTGREEKIDSPLSFVRRRRPATATATLDENVKVPSKFEILKGLWLKKTAVWEFAPIFSVP